jgi:hypothetical protein
MNVQTLANKAEGQWISSDSYSKPTSPRGFQENLWRAMKLLRADYTLIKLLRKEFPVPTACFGRSTAFERFLRKWFYGLQEKGTSGAKESA